MSYLELAKRSLAQGSGGSPPSPIESILTTGERLTLDEIAARSGMGAESAQRELAALTARGEAFSAVDFHRRAEVYWRPSPRVS